MHFEVDSSSSHVTRVDRLVTNQDGTSERPSSSHIYQHHESSNVPRLREKFSARIRRTSVISTHVTSTDERVAFSLTIENDIHTKIIKSMHWVFFGDGQTNWSILLPLLWCGSTFAPLALYQQYFYEAHGEELGSRFIFAARMTVMAFTVMILSTYIFGWFYCRAKHFEDAILTSASSLEDRLYYVRVLAYIYIVCALISVVPPATLLPQVNLDLMVELGIVKTPAGGITLIMFGFYPFFMTNTCQIGLWIWMLYVKYHSFRTKIVPYLIPKYCAYCKEITVNFAENLDRHSSLWKYIHVARLSAGLVISLSYVVNIYMVYNDENIIGGNEHRPVQKAYYISAFILFYGGLWSIVLGSGVLNDIITFKLQNTLSSLLLDMDDEYEDSLNAQDLAIARGDANEGDERLSVDMPVKKIMNLEEAKSMVRDLVIAMGIRRIGLKVAGLVIHAEKALALGSLFFALLTAAAQAGFFETREEGDL